MGWGEAGFEVGDERVLSDVGQGAPYDLLNFSFMQIYAGTEFHDSGISWLA
jgi:hypothetical protein